MTLEEFNALQPEERASILEETAYRIASDMSLDDLIAAEANDLMNFYKQEPEMLIRDAEIWGVIEET